MKPLFLLALILLVWSCNSNAPRPKSLIKQEPKLDTCLLKYIDNNDSLVSIDTVKLDSTNIITFRIMHRDSTGKKKSISEYMDCKKRGTDTVFYSNGQIKYVRDIIGDRIFFTHNFFSIKGETLNPGDVTWGEGTIYNYYEDGQIENKGQIKNGLPDGEWTRYYQNGKISSTTFYHNKNTDAGPEITIDGKMTFYRKSGTIQRESTVDMGIIKYVKEFDEKGVLIREYPANDKINAAIQ